MLIFPLVFFSYKYFKPEFEQRFHLDVVAYHSNLIKLNMFFVLHDILTKVSTAPILGLALIATNRPFLF